MTLRFDVNRRSKVASYLQIMKRVRAGVKTMAGLHAGLPVLTRQNSSVTSISEIVVMIGLQLEEQVRSSAAWGRSSSKIILLPLSTCTGSLYSRTRPRSRGQ
jgi:hypothetical protein